jgi:O-methyltransferase involved in polyketide biosynthesis
MVAASRAVASQGPDALLDDSFADPLVRAVGLTPLIQVIDGEIDLEDDPLLNRTTRSQQIAVRTRFFDDFFTGATPHVDRRAIGIDLRDDWPAALRQHGFDVDQPTAWSAEGLLPYLPPDAQDRLFDNITTLSAPGSQLATEHLPDPQAFAGERAQRISERWRRLGLDLNMADLFYQGERSIVIDYLTNHGWQVDAHPARELYARNGFEFPEDALMATFGEMSYVTATRK